jgi:hypothetical protein
MLKAGTFAEASAQRAGNPYLNGQLLSEGLLLTRYSMLESYELAGDAALSKNAATQNLTLLTTPSCTEGASSSPCVPNSLTSQSDSDQYLQLVVPRLVASAAYRDGGLIVIAFGAASHEASPPSAALGAGSDTAGSGSASGAEVPPAALTDEPSQGALLLSDRLEGGRQISTHFEPFAPRKSLEEIFKR